MPMAPFQWTLFFNPEKEDKSIGLIHECGHVVYRARGSPLFSPEYQKVENLLEKEAQRFAKEEERLVASLVKSIEKTILEN